MPPASRGSSIDLGRRRAKRSHAIRRRVGGNRDRGRRGVVEHLSVQRRARLGVDDDAQAAAARCRASRTVSAGSSASTVPIPTMTASEAARGGLHVEPRARAGDPLAGAVGRRGPPVERRGVLPRDIRTSLRRRDQPRLELGPRLVDQHPGLDIDARRAQSRRSAAGRHRADRRRHRSTRAMPAAMIASEHGPVRPWWLQGSSVTTRVAAAGRVTGVGERDDLGVWPADRLRGTLRRQPSPSRSSTTAPTAGFGLGIPSAAAARRSRDASRRSRPR